MCMNRKISKLKQKGFTNLISFFIEFFLLSSVFSSTINTGNLYSFIVQTFPFITKEILLSGTLSLIILSTSIRTIYARYLNTKIDILEKEMINSKEIQRNVFEEGKKTENNYNYQKVPYKYTN